MKRITLLTLSILFLAATFKGDGKLSSGWYQQFFPNLNGSVINSITFLDSLTGYAVTNTNSSLQAYILKTTNGGDNWMTNYTYTQSNSNWYFVKIGFVNSNIGFAFGWREMFRTTNGGTNWEVIINNLYANDIAIINKDTMLAVSNSGFDGGVYRSTNGGYNWQALGPTGGSGQPSKIYMYNKDMGFCLGGEMRKTTNGGVNWFAIPGETYASIMFVDSLTGWKGYDSIKKTTNGGLNWFSQQLPNLTHSWVTSYVFAQNKDTVWLVGDDALNAPIYKTTNGGVNWGYQRADTSIHISVYGFIYFATNRIGWANALYQPQNSNIHTTTGGNNITYFTGIKLIENYVPSGYTLGQNYPNPFNPTTNIPFELNEASYITLKVYDATGRTVKELINGRWGKGKYVADFDASQLPTGIYFYRIILTGDNSGKTFTDTKRMILLK